MSIFKRFTLSVKALWVLYFKRDKKDYAPMNVNDTIVYLQSKEHLLWCKLYNSVWDKAEIEKDFISVRMHAFASNGLSFGVGKLKEGKFRLYNKTIPVSSKTKFRLK